MIMVLIFIWLAIIFWTVWWATLHKDNVYSWALLATIAPVVAVLIILMNIEDDFPVRQPRVKNKKSSAYKASILAGNPHYVARRDSRESNKRRKAMHKTRYRYTHDQVRAVKRNDRRS